MSNWIKPQIGDKVKLKKGLFGINAKTVQVITAVEYPFYEDWKGDRDKDDETFRGDGWWIKTDKTGDDFWAQCHFRNEGTKDES